MLSGKARLLKERDGVRRRLDEAWVDDAMGIEPPDPFDRRAIRIQYRHDQPIDPSDDSGAYVLAADKPGGNPPADHATELRRERPASTNEGGLVAPIRPRWIQPSLFDAPPVAEFPGGEVPVANTSVAGPKGVYAAVGEMQPSADGPAPPIGQPSAPAFRPNAASPTPRPKSSHASADTRVRSVRSTTPRPIRQTTNEFSWLRFLSGLAVGGVIGAFVLMLIASAT